MNTTRILGAALRRAFLVVAVMMGVAAVASAQTKPADTTKKAVQAPKPAPTTVKTPSAGTQSKTTPPATQSKTTPPATQSKTTPPAAQSKTTPPAAQPKTTPPAAQPKTTPPAGQSTTTPPKATAPVTPPKTNPTATPQKTAVPANAAAAQNKTATAPPGQTKTAGTVPQAKTPVTAPQQDKSVTPPPQTGNAPRAGGAPALNVVRSDTAGASPLILMREVFEYNRDGRRDPFLSLLATTDLRPTLSDLKLLMTVVDEPGRSVALLQDAYDKKQKTVRVGTKLGRMRVSSIRADAVVFTIEEFGANRRDSLLLRDSTKARGR